VLGRIQLVGLGLPVIATHDERGMDSMKRIMTYCLTVLLAAITAVSCGGGAAGVTTPGPSPSFLTSFTPDQPTPGNNSVSLSQAPGGGGNLVTVNVGVTGVNDVFGASFRIVYDPALVDFENWSQGSLIEGAGNTALYQVSAVTPGQVEVGIGCAGCASGINVGSTSTIIQIVFRATSSGNSALTFVAADLLNSQSPPTPIAGLTWDGGTLTAQ